MPAPRVVEVLYHQFMAQLRKAADEGSRIEPTDKQKWTSYVRQNDVKEASLQYVAKARGAENLKAVIIDDDSDWAGYYVYSPDVEMCFKFARDEA